MNVDIFEVLRYIDPVKLNYADWTRVGMALKHEGFAPSVWSEWSRRDPARYNDGECETKWQSFKEATSEIVTMGTLIDMAKRGGYIPPKIPDKALSWNDKEYICEDAKIIEKGWLQKTEPSELSEPKKWNPKQEIITFLETLFLPEDYIGYNMESAKKDGRFIPANAGIYSRKSSQIVDALKRLKSDDIGAVFGDYNPECGAWIRSNALDGKGVKNDNVKDFKYALIESDEVPIEDQYAFIKELNLPVATLVHSGKKSLHALVKIDAKNYAEYRKRVDYVYFVLNKNGFAIDKQNCNPSRLTRLPGIMRDGRKQWLIGTNFGAKNYEEWEEWVAEETDDLPEFENLLSVWDKMPDLAPALIDGILRQGHKMLISGASKAGKSFAQIEMAIAIAEGQKWMGWNCAQGKVVYVNFELDRASCLHRFKDVYNALKIPPENLSNIDIWNLRGQSMQLDKLAPKLIRRAKKIKPLVIILDPIYKVLTGDENNAEQMAKFCNQFDKICSEVKSSVIYCHHHSKGAQGAKKSTDRSSGSGVFGRDPDAILDLIELPLKESNYDFLKDKAVCRVITEYFDARESSWREDLGADDLLSPSNLLDYAKEKIKDAAELTELENTVKNAQKRAEHITAWRIECTLREYEKPDDKNVYFSWPIHTEDETGALSDIRPAIEVNGRIVQPRDKSDGSAKREKAQKERNKIIDAYTTIAASKEADENGNLKVSLTEFVERSKEFFGKELSKPAVRKKLKKYGDYVVVNGVIFPSDPEDADENEE